MSQPVRVSVRVPATTANLGPGFDCLGLALDLWNEVTFSLEGSGVRVTVQGLGAGQVPLDARNLIARSFYALYVEAGRQSPPGLSIRCRNEVPLGSGLGSSAAATLAGLLGANTFLDGLFPEEEILRLAARLEGHPDNAAAALAGGLVIVTAAGEEFITQKIGLPPELAVALAVPQFHLPTRVARAALPRQVPLADAVYNIGRTALVVEALRSGNLELLGRVMQDRLHQPYRLKLIPGASDALAAALRAGAVAAAISGAGPSLVAFGTGDLSAAAEAMGAAFERAGIPARRYCLAVSGVGARIKIDGMDE